MTQSKQVLKAFAVGDAPDDFEPGPFLGGICQGRQRPYAKEALKAREARRKADAARRTRKGLRLVRTDDDEADEQIGPQSIR
jgi:hypothetical protein